MALPEVAPFHIVGTNQLSCPAPWGPNIVKDGTPDHRAQTAWVGGNFQRSTFNFQLQCARSGTPVYRAHIAPGWRAVSVFVLRFWFSVR